jgi:hypothetical protein
MEKGTTNLTTIRDSLKNCEEIELPYDFKVGEKIKYITLDKDTQTEMFYNGGEYVKIGNELIFLQNGPSNWSFRTKLRDDNNDIYYTSRVFIEKKKSDNIYKDKDVKMLKETILAQQRVIERMTKTIREDKIKIQKYENYIHKNK